MLHFFANHELMAAELMALALLKFPDTPARFRRGVARTLRDEQEHLRLYMERMSASGVAFGRIPVSDFFWRAISPMPTPLDFVTPPEPDPGAGQPRLRAPLPAALRRDRRRRHRGPHGAHLPRRDRPRAPRPQLVQHLAPPVAERVGVLPAGPRVPPEPEPRQGDRLQPGGPPPGGAAPGLRGRAGDLRALPRPLPLPPLVQPAVRSGRRAGRPLHAAGAAPGPVPATWRCCPPCSPPPTTWWSSPGGRGWPSCRS